VIPPFLLGPLCGAAGMALAGAAFFGWLHLIHDPAIRSDYAAELAAVVAKERERQHASAAAALEAHAAALAAQTAALAPHLRRIASAPASVACAASPAVRDALAGVRALGAGAAAPGGAAEPAGLPTPARTP
jgi:hypothetical protein